MIKLKILISIFVFVFFFWFGREQPIFTCKAHVFHIDPKTKRSWIPASSSAINVSFFYDSTRSLYRIISVEGTKVRTCPILIATRSLFIAFGGQFLLICPRRRGVRSKYIAHRLKTNSIDLLSSRFHSINGNSTDLKIEFAVCQIFITYFPMKCLNRILNYF